MKYGVDKHRGFAFIEFESEDDARDAIDNMDGSELFGKVLRCNVAKALPKLAPGKAAWSSEEWIQSNLNDENNQNQDDEILPEVTLIPERRIDEDNYEEDNNEGVEEMGQ